MPSLNVEVLAANCDEIDGDFSRPLVANAQSNGVILQDLAAQFVAFRLGDRLPASVEAQITALQQQADAVISGVTKTSISEFTQQVGILINDANVLYNRIYHLIGDPGCDSGGFLGEPPHGRRR